MPRKKSKVTQSIRSSPYETRQSTRALAQQNNTADVILVPKDEPKPEPKKDEAADRKIIFLTEDRSPDGVSNLPEPIILFIIDMAIKSVSTYFFYYSYLLSGQKAEQRTNIRGLFFVCFKIRHFLVRQCPLKAHYVNTAMLYSIHNKHLMGHVKMTNLFNTFPTPIFTACLQVRLDSNLDQFEKDYFPFKSTIVVPKKIQFIFGQTGLIGEIPKQFEDCLGILSNILHTRSMDTVALSFGRNFCLIDRDNAIGIRIMDLIIKHFGKIKELEFVFFHTSQLELLSNLRYCDINRVKFSEIQCITPGDLTMVIGTLCRKKLMSSIQMASIKYFVSARLPPPVEINSSFHFNGLMELTMFGSNFGFMSRIPMIAGSPGRLVIGSLTYPMVTEEFFALRDRFGCEIVHQTMVVYPKDKKI